LPDDQRCFEHLRSQRWPEGVACPRCASGGVIRKGTTRKGAQRYRCRGCGRIFNDLSGTVFAGHQLSLAEMFYVLRWSETESTAQLAEDLDRTYKTVLNVVHQMPTAGDRDPVISPAAVDEVFEH
jgi:transposase-like protein